MKILILSISLIFLLNPTDCFSQVLISENGAIPDSSAILELRSTNKGLLLPRLTTLQINNIKDPVEGLLIYNIDNKSLFVHDGHLWKNPTPVFYCGDQISDIDSNIYNTVLIGDQCWMADNLNTGLMINSSTAQSDDNVIEKYCYENDNLNCDLYGALYVWDEVMQYTNIESSQGVCPSGWHIPSDDEYKTMEIDLGMSLEQADMTSARGTNEGSKSAGIDELWLDGNLDSNSEFGSSRFSSLPAGRGNPDGTFEYMNQFVYYWSSSILGTKSFSRYLRYSNSKIYRSGLDRSTAFSVRCVKD